MGNTEHIGTEENFLDRTLMAYVLRIRIDKWDLKTLKNFFKPKGTVSRTKWHATDWVKISTNTTSYRELISKYTMNSRSLIPENQIIL